MINENIDRIKVKTIIKIYEEEAGIKFGNLNIEISENLTKVNSRVVFKKEKILGFVKKKPVLQLSKNLVSGIYQLDDVINSIGHELAHIYVYKNRGKNSHGAEFKRACKKLGISKDFWNKEIELHKTKNYYFKTKKVTGYVGYCSNCGEYLFTVFSRQEAIRQALKYSTACCKAPIEYYEEEIIMAI